MFVGVMFIFIQSPFILVLASQFSVSLMGLRIVELELEDTDDELISLDFFKGLGEILCYSFGPAFHYF